MRSDIQDIVVIYWHLFIECTTYSPPTTVVFILILTFEALLFAIFTAVMFGTQIQAIWNDETVSFIIYFFFDSFHGFSRYTSSDYFSGFLIEHFSDEHEQKYCNRRDFIFVIN